MTLSNWLLNDVQEDTTDDVNNTNDAIETTFEINVPVAKEDSFSSSTCSLYKSAKNFNQKKKYCMVHTYYVQLKNPDVIQNISRLPSSYLKISFFSPMHQHPFFMKKMYTI